MRSLSNVQLSHPVASVVFTPHLIQNSGQQNVLLWSTVCVKVENIHFLLLVCYFLCNLSHSSASSAEFIRIHNRFKVQGD